MRILLEKYNIRYFPKIANELLSSPVKRIIIYWIQFLDMFLTKAVAISVSTNVTVAAIETAGALSWSLSQRHMVVGRCCSICGKKLKFAKRTT
jgi:hypothetical protein